MLNNSDVASSQYIEEGTIGEKNIEETKLEKNPEAFTEQLNQIIHELLNKFKLAIKRVIYYVDNKNDISKNDMKKLYMSIKNKN
jgi:hypothetical protein